ncbi:hypothetical protein BDP27DRAFT_1371973 [Rhodocollybia butyracea]|uniref:Uncharacterized protein n=1 Tax=Rhodocollybia butyracea TaxID=206335 RepID=A0A9P5TZ14_9AGAR|nr:hypothetical protein BDP27DRAFT_1371973 [Rhodocollybia butyracea]
MPPSLSSSTYYFSVGLGGMLYGVFLALTAIAAVLDIKHRRSRPLHEQTILHGRGGPRNMRRQSWLKAKYLARFMIPFKFSFSQVVTVLLGIIITTHRGNLMYRGCMMFVVFGGGQAGENFLDDPSQSSETISNVSIALTSLIFDAAMCYRLRVFYIDTWMVIVIPALTFVGQIGGISLQIWRHNHRLASAGIGRSLNSSIGILGILIESSLLYTGWNIVYIFAYAIGTNKHSSQSALNDFLIDTWIPLAGVSFVLITLLENRQWKIIHGATSRTRGPLTFAVGPTSLVSMEIREEEDIEAQDPPLHHRQGSNASDTTAVLPTMDSMALIVLKERKAFEALKCLF